MKSTGEDTNEIGKWLETMSQLKLWNNSGNSNLDEVTSGEDIINAIPT